MAAPPTEADLWTMVVALAARARRGAPVVGPVGLAPDGADGLAEVAPDDGVIVIDPGAARRWRWPGPPMVAPDDARAALLDLYVPLCAGPAAGRLVVGHLAQSLDGRIATEAGESQFISGAEDLRHAHRMRALFDAVVVGAATVAQDDPRLTTRLVPGAHPVRVVIDPERRLEPDHAVFRDGLAPTLLVCRADHATPAPPPTWCAELVPVEGPPGAVPVAEILAALARRGLGRVFIEGGGVTISHFLAAGALDRLHVAVAPCILGSGRPAFSLPPIGALADALSFPCRHFALGPDVLFDCDLGGGASRG